MSNLPTKQCCRCELLSSTKHESKVQVLSGRQYRLVYPKVNPFVLSHKATSENGRFIMFVGFFTGRSKNINIIGEISAKPSDIGAC
jgi:hypothetical protein